MTLPDAFQFTQGNLQDYADCRRRFQLRYLQRLAWPAIEMEPALEYERHLQRGARFHQMIQQHLLGVPAERLTRMAASQEVLNEWWQHYLDYASGPAGLDGLPADQKHPEITLTAEVAGHRLIAKYDLVAVTPAGRVQIFDWKTYQTRRPRTWLIERLQTRVYPYLLVRSGAYLNRGTALIPEQIEMIYWFANFPDPPERLPYSDDQFQADGEFLQARIEEIAGLDEEAFFKTDVLARCRFCNYRSFCERGIEAGQLEAGEGVAEAEAGVDIDLDFDQIAELEY